jgi:hypothetical protein
MANTYTLISSVTVGSGGANSIDFTSIPSTYTDLVLKVSVRDASNNYGSYQMRFNNSSTNYSGKWLYGEGSGAYSNNAFGIAITTTDQTANVFVSTDIYIPNYTSSNYKSASIDNVTENNATTAYAHLTPFLWSDTSAINRITLGFMGSDNFAQYSTAYLYGISNA